MSQATLCNRRSKGFICGHIAVIVFLLGTALGQAQPNRPIELLSPPLQGFYGKRLVTRDGIPILAHAAVADAALFEAARRVDRLLHQTPRIASNLVALHVELHLIGKDQATTDLPEYRSMKGKPFEGKLTMDQRGRGYGGLDCSCSEENLLMLPSDRFADHRDICSHEFAHAILQLGVTPAIRHRVEAQWHKATAAGKWKKMYAGTNPDEYFAELTMWYLGSRGDYGSLKPPPSPGPDWLRSYDPEAYQLLDGIYTGRLAPETVVVTDLNPLPASVESHIRSRDGDAACIIFENRTARTIRLEWLDFQGHRKDYGVVEPHARHSLETYATHVWLLLGEDGSSLGIYVAGTNVNRVVVRN